MEKLIQDLFEEHLKKLNLKYKRGCKIDNSFIDFLVDYSGKMYGVEIKSSFSKINSTIGQLINFSRFFSHLILVAPRDFLVRFEEVVKETNILKQIGMIAFENGDFIEVKKPKPEKYFLRIHAEMKEKRKIKEMFTKDRFTEDEIKFFIKFKDRSFMVCDVVANLNKKRAAIYHFLSTLKKLGFIEEVAGTYPKSFRITSKLFELVNQT